MSNLVSLVLDGIKGWSPHRRPDWHERNYRDELLQELNTRGGEAVDVAKSRWLTNRIRRPDITVTSTGKSGVRFAGLRDRVLLELKLNLTKRRELTRLREQIEDILERPEPPAQWLVVLLLGKTRPEFLVQLGALDDASERPVQLGRRTVLSRRLRVLSVPFV